MKLILEFTSLEEVTAFCEEFLGLRPKAPEDSPKKEDKEEPITGYFLEEERLWTSGQRIEAVKRIRERTGCTLKAAKDYCEATFGKALPLFGKWL